MSGTAHITQTSESAIVRGSLAPSLLARGGFVDFDMGLEARFGLVRAHPELAERVPYSCWSSLVVQISVLALAETPLIRRLSKTLRRPLSFVGVM